MAPTRHCRHPFRPDRRAAWVAGLLLALGGAAETIGADAANAKPLRRLEYSQRLMGMDYRVLLYAADEVAANRSVAMVWDRVAALDEALSDYNPNSEAMRLCRESGPSKRVAVSEDLWNLLTMAQRWSVRTNGAFDVTVGPLVRQWRRARRQKQLPTPDQLAQAGRSVGYSFVALHEKGRRVELLQPGMRLDFGGIAVGYAVDEALRILKEQGVAAALVDGSGDVGVMGSPPGAAGWQIEISPRREKSRDSHSAGPFVELSAGAVSTSGDAYQAVEIDGVRYSHIVDPATGLGLTVPSSVTVVAPDCATADVLATAVSVLGPEQGLKLVDSVPGAAVYFVQLVDGREEVSVSSESVFRMAPSGLPSAAGDAK